MFGINPLMMTPVGGSLKPQDVFAATLWAGNGSTQAIATGIDLATDGGLFWAKSRSNATGHLLADTLRGTAGLGSDRTAAQTATSDLVAFNSTGVSLGLIDAYANAIGRTYVGWSFRRAAKFFDVVTWAGNGVDGRQIAHALGVTPGIIIVKRTDSATDWYVWHRSLSTNQLVILNTTAAASNWPQRFLPAPDSATFGVGNPTAGATQLNASGAAYVAYLFAHDPDPSGIVQCGSAVDNGSVTTVTLGWRPQYILAKAADIVGPWLIYDSFRSMTSALVANTAGAEAAQAFATLTSTGFTFNNNVLTTTGKTLIYLAIREPI